ncbi:hypothetical protein [Pontiella sulfatireligans]|uniref:Uncharacterized protein n=1 Tax=Pontiella sulfatireligans TaxID=2750658 RepID=A0A6C2UL48_9BACT|nr:hypothetical protein [Pontiella sulfatireligans]VGO20828.1 hypothetical protein SCARR_02895 [Pontiella sulfatireligans]
MKIYNNKIIQIFKPLMVADHVENLEFYDNEISAGKDYASWFKGKAEPPNIRFGPGVTTGRFQKLDNRSAR